MVGVLCFSRICLWLGMLSPLLSNVFFRNKNGTPLKNNDMSRAWAPLPFNDFARKSEGVPLGKQGNKNGHPLDKQGQEWGMGTFTFQ